MAHLSAVSGKKMAHKEGQQHPIKLYLIVWGWLFVLSTCSYLVDYFGIEGFLRWFLILLFMIVKAGLIVAVFMHMAWERLALMYAILAPPGAVLLFVAIMAFESDYTHVTRLAFFGTGQASAEVATLAPKPSGSGTGTATATAPPDQSKKAAKKHGPDSSKAESKGDRVVLSGSAAATGEAGTTAPAGGNAAGIAATGEAGKTAQASGNPAGVAAVQNNIAAAAKALEAKFYTSKPGDTLWKIAETEYGPGHGGKYHLIFEANKTLLSAPGKLSPGQVLRIPPLSG
jgi:cytochrome c oxidase subunit 4